MSNFEISFLTHCWLDPSFLIIPDAPPAKTFDPTESFFAAPQLVHVIHLSVLSVNIIICRGKFKLDTSNISKLSPNMPIRESQTWKIATVFPSFQQCRKILGRTDEIWPFLFMFRLWSIRLKSARTNENKPDSERLLWQFQLL